MTLSFSPSSDSSSSTRLTQALESASINNQIKHRHWIGKPRSPDFKIAMSGAIKRDSPSSLPDDQIIALWSAALSKSPEGESLLQKPLFFHASSQKLMDPFCLAIEHKREDVALWMLERGACPNALIPAYGQSSPMSVFQQALCNNFARLAIAICRHSKFNPDTLDPWGRPIIHNLGYYSGPEEEPVFKDLLDALLEKGGDLSDPQSFVDPEGDTPLHSAALYLNKALAKELIDRGASAEALNAKGQTPAEIPDDIEFSLWLNAYAKSTQEKKELERVAIGAASTAPGLKPRL